MGDESDSTQESAPVSGVEPASQTEPASNPDVLDPSLVVQGYREGDSPNIVRGPLIDIRSKEGRRPQRGQPKDGS
jgi:hypothetical protein